MTEKNGENPKKNVYGVAFRGRKALTIRREGIYRLPKVELFNGEDMWEGLSEAVLKYFPGISVNVNEYYGSSRSQDGKIENHVLFMNVRNEYGKLGIRKKIKWMGVKDLEKESLGPETKKILERIAKDSNFPYFS
jgi:hypothetical protein